MHVAYSQDEIEFVPLDRFTVNELPSEDELRDLNRHSMDWTGIVKNGDLFFFDRYDVEFYGDTLPFPIEELADHVKCRIGGGNYHILQNENDWYIGTNRGEWGGTLFKLSSNFKKCSEICHANVNQLFTFEDKVYMVEGLSHLGLSGGTIVELKDDQTLDTLLTLDETPRYLLFNTRDEGYLLTDSKLYAINTKMDTTCLFHNEEFPYLYPSNLILYEDTLYVAMRGGILTFCTRTKEVKWLTRKE